MRFSSVLSGSLEHLTQVLIPLVLMTNVAAAQSSTITRPTVDLAPSDLRLLIETDRTTYRLGDSIRVRLTLVNSSSRRIVIPVLDAQSMAALLIHDATGRKVAPTVSDSRRPTSGPPIPLEPLKPQEEMVLKWAHSKWVNLREFGYELEFPGCYAISGFPLLAPPHRNLRVDPDRSLLKYNEVALTITR